MKLGGQRDLVSRVVMGITRVTIWFWGVTALLTYLLGPPDPPSEITMILWCCRIFIPATGTLNLKPQTLNPKPPNSELKASLEGHERAIPHTKSLGRGGSGFRA